MMKKLLIAMSILMAFSTAGNASPDSVQIDTIDNYNGWGWETLVVKNNYITLSIVPFLGGRVLQYNLGVDSFMIVNEDLNSDIFTPAPGSIYGPYQGEWGYGGYKTWPAPQSEWNWPPPPIMAWGEYSYEVTHASADSVIVYLQGQTEEYQAPGLRFDRYFTAYKNSTRVKVETILYNENSSDESWSIWDVTQTVVEHENENDFTNFSGYVPIADEADFWINAGGPSYEEVLPGIYKLQYVSQEGKFHTAASEGWSCFVDERDSQCYAKLFDLVPGADYPDQGTNVQYYTNGGNNYMEMEVLGPIESIPANGGSISFTEDWYATAANGPMYTANHAGIVLEPLLYDRIEKSVVGTYGVFNEGDLRIAFLDAADELISTSSLINVYPDTLVQLNEVVDAPGGTKTLELQAYDNYGNYIASLGQTALIGDDSFTALKAGTDVVIDGLADETFWDSASWYPLDYVWLPYGDDVSPEDFTGKFKISWNDEKLLLLVEIVDDVLSDIYSNPLDNYWNDDCVEVFLDENKSGGNHLNSFNAFAYHVSTTFDVVDNGLSGAELFNDHIDAAWTQDGNTYLWELAIDIYDDSYVSTSSSTPVTLVHQKLMGFSLAYCDNDVSATRENFIGSKYLEASVSNDSYINASLFGELELIDPKGGTEPPPPPPESLANRSKPEVKVYPNPANDIIFLEFSGELNIANSYSLHSLTGQQVKSGVFAETERASIPVEQLNSGIYVLKIRGAEFYQTIQITIQ